MSYGPYDTQDTYPGMVAARRSLIGRGEPNLMRRISTLTLLAALILAPVTAPADGSITLSNGIVSRTWDATALRTTTLTGPGVAIVGAHPDLHLEIDGIRIPSDALPVNSVDLSTAGDGAQTATWSLGVPGTLEIIRSVSVYPGIAGFAARTTIVSGVPATLSGYTLDEVGVHLATPTLHSFRAGADWREPGWSPTLLIGDGNTGEWRKTTTAAPGAPLRGTAQWATAALTGGARIGMVLERRDYASSVGSYDGETLSSGVDLSRDIAYTGPFESDVHVQNPVAGPGRHRVLAPGTPLVLEPVFTVIGADADDETWQFHKYLTQRRLQPYRKDVVFNSNNIEDDIVNNNISTGAKDNLNFDRFLPLADAARELGVDTFVFDDGWQAISGDWCPDSDACPEPRRASDPVKFRARFPDDTFAAVREVLAGAPGPDDDLNLGLWMTPMEFHPASAAFKQNPQWACAPVGDATAAISIAEPNGGSNEAGLGVWNPLALGVDPDTGAPTRLIDYIEGRILRAIDVYGAKYFKFDFLAWVDCGGAYPVTMYEYHDAFVEMVDRVLVARPDVTIEIDETNDYRMFPYESVARGPSWFLNGSPTYTEALHTLWNLAPYVPGFSLGQATISNGSDLNSRGIDTLMAAGLTSHMTIWTRIDTSLTPAQRARAKRWTDFYKANLDSLAGFTYPLLSDPRSGGWTALQTWNGDTRSGFLLAFDQGAPNATQTIALRGLGNVNGSTQFRLTRHEPGDATTTDLGVFDAATLRAGFPVTIATSHGNAVIEIAQI